LTGSPKSHAPFAVWNQTLNPIVKATLRSPLHGLIDDRTLLITVTGRSSGREYTFPVGYEREGERVKISVGWPERKRWWRNLREPAPVRLRIKGEQRIGTATARGDERSGVTVEVELDPAL
jgi:hypothetical protein